MASEPAQPLEHWRETLRALSSVVDLFASSNLRHPDDNAILDRLEEAEANARRAYRDSLNAPGWLQQFPTATPRLGAVGFGLSPTDLVGIGSTLGSLQPVIGVIGAQYPPLVDQFRRVEVSVIRNSPRARDDALGFKGTLLATAGGAMVAEPFLKEIDNAVHMIEQLIAHLHLVR